MGITRQKDTKMKNKYINYFLFVFIGMAFFSCSSSDDYADGDIPGLDDNDRPIYLGVMGQPLPDNLQCDMYIFQKASTDSEDEYSLNKMQVINPNGDNKIAIKNIDLIDKTYRFFFVATSKNSKEVELKRKDGTVPTIGTRWEDIMINSNQKLVSGDNYQGFTDKTSEQILESKSINASLTRVVGQVKFDIYKVTKQGENYVSAAVEAPHFNVLDRVHKIEIEYSNITQGAIFDENNSLTHHKVWTGTYTQKIEPALFMGENPWYRNFKIDEQQVIQDLEYSEEKAGSAHIKGIYCMPSDKNMKVKLTFHYYDTTPLCSETEHIHSSACYDRLQPTICGFEQHTHMTSCYKDGVLICTKPVHIHRKECYAVESECGMDEYIYNEDCFEEKFITLNIPQKDSSMDLLSVKPNHYTVNTAKIRYNRIIDVGVNFSFVFDTLWKNDINE